ncbi:anthranilate phosphoribosyltransferase [Akkermansia sp. N21169]|uniref:anthranilate phosphoribosyltransferase n=1 Tax=Akkermansia sp. N21169 TaxID=3040765 RepID=UPI00244E8E8D|nr:anthranilate phosphoribosyltransferase [Akkermansia sp. N21169]MDH3068107.1 anthranilate phosphoribosyltransferase [Akkermansia sp. N21169]
MFLLIDNYDSFTYNLVQAFYTLGRNPVVLTNDDPRILELATDPELTEVCLSPGPSHPANAGLCLEFLKRLPAHIPVLGVCLGHQLLGHFAGAEVSRAPYVMHGKCSDIDHDEQGLFEGISNPMKVGRYHSLVVQSPENAPNPRFTVTARGPENEVMALRYNDRPWVGVQFHPESILTPEGLTLLANFPNTILPDQHRERRVSNILDTLAEGNDLSAEIAASAFASLMDGHMTSSQAGSFLMGLRMKGETPLELACAMNIGLNRAVRVNGIEGKAIDIVGTGGDGRSSFNCSTVTALTMAGMGYKVIKHGNRAVSSTCGSADAIEALGLPLDTAPDQVKDMLSQRNFTFLFAPNYHPAFRNVGLIRRELGVRTIFNLLGPLLNPARPSHILLGVARPELVGLIAEALKKSHFEKAAVVHGAGGYDELTPIGPAMVAIVRNGKREDITVEPSSFGIAPCTPEELTVRTKDAAVRVLHELLEGRGTRPMQDMVALNLGLAIYLMEDDQSLPLCIARAREAVTAGVGRKPLHVA